jgi:hypothetical protein
MKRRELEVALRAASRVAGEFEFILIGSQALHAHCRRPPSEVLLSQECDLYPKTRPETANLLDAELGRRSAFARKHGFYVDIVTPELATLPGGWEKRLKALHFGPIRALCLEVHDLLVSKLAAGRLKDLEMASAVLKLKLGNAQVLRRRINQVPHEAERLRLRRRLQTVLDELAQH